MNITIITGGFPTPLEPGKYAFVDQLACAWADQGHDITVICPVPFFVELFDKKRFYKNEWQRITEQQNSLKVICPRYMGLSNKKIAGIRTNNLSYCSVRRAIIRAIKRNGKAVDFLYAHFLPQGCHAGDIGEKMGIPAYCAFGESSLWSIKNMDLEKVKKSLAKLRGIISVSSENKKVLSENGLFREADIIVLPNGVDHELFYPRNKTEVRKKLGFPEEQFIGAYVGAFNESKGSLRAQKAAVDAGDTKMIFIGGGSDTPKGDNILFSGRLQHEDIPEYLSAADFFILPTKAEGCCNAIIEAMACGLPVISSNGVYNDDILSEEYSIRIAPSDVGGMKNAIKLLRDNPIQRKKMSITAETASQRFDVFRRAEEIIRFMVQKAEGR